ncbi:MAG TPA: response regulator [Vicinamibacteria bacterium]|nr:response regulator [Vicinamibacteria bacterium]
MGEPDDVPVLLVEDNPDHEELVRRSFFDHGARISLHVARHGEEALDYLFRRGEFRDAARSPRPRLILLDLRLPRMDGLEVLAEIKAAPDLRTIPTVVLTTSESEHDLARACAHHVNSYLVKPVEFARFEELIADVESYWLILNRQPGEGARKGCR